MSKLLTTKKRLHLFLLANKVFFKAQAKRCGKTDYISFTSGRNLEHGEQSRKRNRQSNETNGEASAWEWNLISDRDRQIMCQ